MSMPDESGAGSPFADLGYAFDEARRCWVAGTPEPFDYNDGDEVEERLYHLVCSASDLGSTSSELRDLISDWPSRYHLSPLRANALRPLASLLRGRRILEIGAGCGAISRFLGECGARVVSVEGSLRRAATAAARCRDQPHVAVVADAFHRFPASADYDVVTLIGVLEYAPRHFPAEGADPVQAMLARARRCLRPGGLLIVAVENQLGLKYLAGYREDHVGVPMFGVEDLYPAGAVVTFGRQELGRRLAAEGFEATRWLYPLPDYKLATTVLTEQGADPASGADLGPLLSASVFSDLQRPAVTTFSLEQAWRVVYRNGLAGELANSFVVVAGQDALPPMETDVLAHYYSVERRPEFMKRLVFRKRDGRVTVDAAPFDPGLPDPDVSVRQVVEGGPFEAGEAWSQRYLTVVNRPGWSVPDLVAWAETWLQHLLAAAGLGERRAEVTLETELPVELGDALPFNLMVDAAGRGRFFDLEWRPAGRLELGYVLYRGILNSLARTTTVARPAPGTPLQQTELFAAVARGLGLPLSAAAMKEYSRQEGRFIAAALGREWQEFEALDRGAALQIRTTLEEALHEARHLTAQRDHARAEAVAAEAARLEAERLVAEMRGATFWRATLPLRVAAHQAKRAWTLGRMAPGIVRGHGLGGVARLSFEVYAKEGMRGVRRRIGSAAGRGPAPDPRDYAEWVRRYDTLDAATRKVMAARVAAFAARPLVSIVMPVYEPPERFLDEAVESVRRQIYPHWELCIADDASSRPGVRKLIEKHAARDKRIKVVYRSANGHIAAASNSALQLARGEWIVLQDQDDVLAEHALFWLVESVNQHPAAGVFYSDEDKLLENGARSEPYFKCDFNPDLFRSHNMLSHLGAYRASLVREVGGFREGFEGSQDYDLALRCVEKLAPSEVVHIPRVLYHWRAHRGSTAFEDGEKPYAVVAGQRALAEHIERTGAAADVVILPTLHYRVVYRVPEPAPVVDLVIPTRNGLQLLRRCVESILEKTDYPAYRLVIVDNGSDDRETLGYLADLPRRQPRVRVQRDDRPFNYSAINNRAVRSCAGELVGLLNNDLEVITPGWLREMVGLALQPGVGAVGARLWYPNDTLQHGGVILGLGGVAGHSHKHFPRGDPGYFRRAESLQTLSAVTAACLVIRRRTYLDVGGLDEDLKVAFNDVDFCLRVREAGYRNVWTPFAELYHHESATRGYEDSPEKIERFQSEIDYVQKKWGPWLVQDPCYSPNLTHDREDFSYAWPPRLPALTSAG
jgi:GT2 family glycosyltransferase/SAM-dependent methyltransferase